MGDLFDEPPFLKKSTKVFWAVLAAIWAALVLVAVLCSCAVTPWRGHWRSSLEVTYANGQRITTGAASGYSAGPFAQGCGAPGPGQANNGRDSR